MATMIYNAIVKGKRAEDSAARAIVRDLDMYLKKAYLEKKKLGGKTKAIARYDSFNNSGARSGVIEVEPLELGGMFEMASVSIAGREEEIRETKSKLLKLVSGLELS